MHRLLPLLLLFVVACRARTAGTVAEPPTTAAAIDIHSFARPQQVEVDHFGLQLDVDFTTRTLHGTATFRITRHDREAPLRLDTRGLDVSAIEVVATSDAPAVDERLADVQAAWKPTTWKLHDAIEHLGRGLEITLPDETVLVRIHYRTVPDATGLQWLSPEQTADRVAPFLYTQSQAIHARSWFPCQDSPGIRSTHDALIRTPAPTRALMAAQAIEGGAPGSFAFVMHEPVPAYLVALAAGNVEFAALGERSGVWAEPSMVAGAAHEFADVERMLVAIEALYGPYRWGRYDVLVLPPSFPFGGMENPRLTFATPTIIAGDRSLVSLIAHELAHSWSGNLVTNATWQDLWLNEGFTVYLERRIIESLFGRERADMDAVLGHEDLVVAFDELGPDDERLRIELTGRDPDLGLSDVAYEKGALLLHALERAHGREAFDRFLARWFAEHAFGSVTTEQFEASARTLGPPLAGEAAVDLDAWIHAPGLPAGAVIPKAAAFDRVDEALAAFVAGTIDGARLPTMDWVPQQWLHFLRGLPRGIGAKRLAEIEAKHRLSGSTNREILAQWLEVAVREGHRESDAALESFLLTIGRRKFVLPLYQALVTAGRGEDARKIFARARAGYHPITQASVDALLAG